MSGRPLLAAFRFAALSSSAPGRPPLALRAVACRAAIPQPGRGAGPQLPLARSRPAGGNGHPSLTLPCQGRGGGHPLMAFMSTPARWVRFAGLPLPLDINRTLADVHHRSRGSVALAPWLTCPPLTPPVNREGNKRRATALPGRLPAGTDSHQCTAWPPAAARPPRCTPAS
jgi:hypothetical protein